MQTEYEYICFEHESPIWWCLNKRWRTKLGSVYYHEEWNQWVFWPITSYATLHSARCLHDIAHFLEQLNEAN